MAEHSPFRIFLWIALVPISCATLTCSETCREMTILSSRIDEMVDTLHEVGYLKQSLRKLTRTQDLQNRQLQELKRTLPSLVPTASTTDGFQRDAISVSTDDFFPLRQLVFQEKRNRQNLENMVNSSLKFLNDTYSALWKNFTEMREAMHQTEDILSSIEKKHLKLDKEVSTIRNTLENITTTLSQTIPKTLTTEVKDPGEITKVEDNTHPQINKALLDIKELQVEQSKLRNDVQDLREWSFGVKILLESQQWNEVNSRMAGVEKSIQGLQWSLLQSNSALNQIRETVKANQDDKFEDMSWNFLNLKETMENLKSEVNNIKSSLKQKEVADYFRKAMLDRIKDNEEIASFPSELFGPYRNNDKLGSKVVTTEEDQPKGKK